MSDGGRSIESEIASLRSCESVGEVDATTQRLVEALGANQYVYLAVTYSDEDDEPLDFWHLAGCDPNWTQRYLRQMGYWNDPFLQYAKVNTLPATGSELNPLLTPAQARNLAEAADFGLHSHLVIPLQTRGIQRLSVFYVSSANRPSDGGEDRLLDKRIWFRALALELHDWHTRSSRESGGSRFDLNPREVEILRLKGAGRSAQEIGDQLGIAPKTVHNAYVDINEKMKTRNIAQSVAMARMHRVID
ncbi:helix-turn-helix transcriptional regulator [Burkholderia cepacia]|uniref:helix-turn-helix transcriptional regulator n=1 Tax=Burkholderia cepacia TaxID=292 RepID=UPI002AB61A92|nr:LuxR C-terminal-related transcriptional regulator [Burkholderia cepacia]